MRISRYLTISLCVEIAFKLRTRIVRVVLQNRLVHDSPAVGDFALMYDALFNKAEHLSDFDARLALVRPLLADNLAETIPQDVQNATTSGHWDPGITELTISFA